MTPVRRMHDSNPQIFMTICCEASKTRLCRTLARIWEKPDFLIKPTIRETVSHVIEQSLLGETLCPDLVLIDMESGERDANAIFDTIRSITGLQKAPLIALLEGEDIKQLHQTYDAGADLVIFWDKLDSRTGDIAALAIDHWLNTEDEEIASG